MLLNSLSFYLSFSVYFDCGLVFIIQSNINTKSYVQIISTNKYISRVHIECRAIAVFWMYPLSDYA